MNFLSNSLREEGGFEYKKAIVDSIVTLISEIPDAKEIGLLYLCEFIEDCEFTYLSSQVITLAICCWLSNNWLTSILPAAYELSGSITWYSEKCWCNGKKRTGT